MEGNLRPEQRLNDYKCDEEKLFKQTAIDSTSTEIVREPGKLKSLQSERLCCRRRFKSLSEC